MSKVYEVEGARLHFELFMNGVGTIGSVLPPKNKTIPGLKLYTDDKGLVVEVGPHRALVPDASIQVLYLAPEAPVTKVSPKSA